jgi:hypothetical protein
MGLRTLRWLRAAEQLRRWHIPARCSWGLERVRGVLLPPTATAAAAAAAGRGCGSTGAVARCPCLGCHRAQPSAKAGTAGQRWWQHLHEATSRRRIPASDGQACRPHNATWQGTPGTRVLHGQTSVWLRWRPPRRSVRPRQRRSIQLHGSYPHGGGSGHGWCIWQQ